MSRALPFPFALVALSGCSGGPSSAPMSAAPGTCVEPPPCVYVTPDPEEAAHGTVPTYRGVGWEPGEKVETLHGDYCFRAPTFPGSLLDAPDATYGCTAIGRSETLRVDRRGGFTYRFVQTPTAPRELAGTVGFGAGPVVFSQRGTGPGTYAHLDVDAIPLGRPGSSKDRDDARRLARVLLTTRRAIDAKPNVVPRASIRRYRASSCRSGGRRSGRVGRVGLDLALETGNGLLYSPVQADLERFAFELTSLATRDPELRAAAAAWARHIRERSEAPRCEIVPRWTGTHFEWSEPTIGPSAEGLGEGVSVDPAIRRGARRLRQLGAGDRAQELFAGGIIGVDSPN